MSRQLVMVMTHGYSTDRPQRQRRLNSLLVTVEALFAATTHALPLPQRAAAVRRPLRQMPVQELRCGPAMARVVHFPVCSLLTCRSRSHERVPAARDSARDEVGGSRRQRQPVRLALAAVGEGAASCERAWASAGHDADGLAYLSIANLPTTNVTWYSAAPPSERAAVASSGRRGVEMPNLSLSRCALRSARDGRRRAPPGSRC